MSIIRLATIVTIIGFLELVPSWARHRLFSLNSRHRSHAQETMLFKHDSSFYLY